MARAQLAATAVTAVIVAAVCGVIVSTTGQTVAIERDVLSRIDDAGTRTIILEDSDGRAQFDPGAIDRIEALVGVEWAIGFGPASDVRAAGLDGGPGVPIRSFVGALPPAVTTSAWNPERGVALAGIEALHALGFETAAGPIQPVGRNEPQIGVGGWVRADPPLEFLNRALLTVANENEPVVRIIVLASSADRVAGTTHAIRALLDPEDPTSVSVRTSDALVQVRAAVQGELGNWGRNVVTLVLGAGLILTAMNVLGAVTARRRDFGRRRALGASRLDIMLLVTAQTVATAIAGAVAGALVGTVFVYQVLGTAPHAEFAVAVSTLAVLAAGAAALPPAVIAAYRDPVRILRLP